MLDLTTICYNPHPATTESFDVLYSELSRRVALGLINISVSETGLELFNYSRQCQYDNVWDKYTMMARGLILDPKNKKVVAYTFPRFFNFGEVSDHIPNESFMVSMKLDGSLGIIYFFNNKWNVATRGSFVSEQAQWAEKWLHENVDIASLNKSYTYITEVIYKENRIVIKYEKEGLFLITVYDDKGYELGLIENIKGLEVVKTYNYKSIDELVSIADKMTSQEEGFVVRFESGYRLKIKGSEYVRIHRIISNLSPLAIWESMMNKDNMELIRKELPEEILVDMDTIVNILARKERILLEDIHGAYHQTLHMTDKELGLFLQSKENTYDHNISKFIFPCRKDDFLGKIWEVGKHRQRLFDAFRPTGNKLEGYFSSTIINRFSKEEDN